ncbi:MAG: DNA polymerase III subunit delta [Rhizobiaceae bacterium]
MAQKKAYEVQGWLTRPDPRVVIVLLYGPDRGLVSERARAFAEKTGVALDDPFSVVRLDAAEADQQGRLLDEARTVPMFAAQRLLWVRNVGAQKNIADDVKTLCADPPNDAVVLIEAGELKKGAALRSTVESSPVAIALPCYADEARDLDQLIDQVLSEQNIRIDLDARAALRRSLGGDRLASRGELQKLALYAADKGTVSVEDVRLLTGDMSAQSLDDAIDAALEGRLGDFDAMFQRHAQAGGQTFLALSGMARQLLALQLMRAELDSGKGSIAQIVAAARPPVFFSRKKTMELALRRFAAPFLARALERLHTALLQTRRRPDLSAALTRQALLGIAIESARHRELPD